MSELAQVLVSAFGFLTACVVSLRYIAGYWFKQQKELRNLEKRIYDKAIADLNTAISGHTAQIKSFSMRMQVFEDKVDGLVKKFDENKTRLGSLTVALEQFVQDTEKRFVLVERLQKESDDERLKLKTQVLQIGKDVRMFKSGGNK